jgi:uncharacterized protein (TIGR02302 family)
MSLDAGHNRPLTATQLARKIGLARLALAFERLWAALHWPIVILATAAAVLLSGGMIFLAPWLRLVLITLTGLILLWSMRPLLRLRWPSRHEAIRRVEDSSGLAHRPIAGREDSLPDNASPLQHVIWNEHRQRQLLTLSGLKVGTPRSAWRDIDPRALRVPATLAVVVALLLGPGDPGGTVASSLAVSPGSSVQPVTVDAWLKPPAYTGKPPVLLTSPAMTERLAADPDIQVPVNSTLALRVSGGTLPTLSFRPLLGGDAPGSELTGFKHRIKQADGMFQAEVKLDRPAAVILTDGGTTLGSWHISLIPDSAPTIEITAEPTGDPSGMLTAPWKVTDDYGVTGVTADIYLADDQDEGVGFSDAGIFEFQPPKLPIRLRQNAAKDETGESKADMAEHPWAGFMVEMTLTATDAAGNRTESEKRVFRLPERQFTRLLARALIEQRRRLILNPDEAGGVAEMLVALLAYPEGLIDRSGTHIAIATALSRLRAAANRDSIDTVINMLWQIAINIEDGAFADAKAELDALRKELQKALREGAPPERIAELTRQLREALDRYMQSMMEEVQKQLDQDGVLQQNMPREGRVVSPQDLQKMLDMIEQLAQSGANDAAEQLLSELENILRNLRPGMPQQGEGQDSPLNGLLNELSDLMRQQQKLMDDTQRVPRSENFEDGQPQPGGQVPQGMESLGDRQQELGQMLGDLMRQFGQNGTAAPRALGEAGEDMGQAEDSLRGGDRDGALGQQGEALAKLREGARGLARQMMQQSQGQQDSEGRAGESRGDDRDPLGRPMRSRGEDTGPDRDMLPSEQAIQRAREILDMLRAKAGDAGLPRLERDYIERLLRGLY